MHTVPHFAIDEALFCYTGSQIWRSDDLEWHHTLRARVEGQRHRQILDVKGKVFQLHCQHERSANGNDVNWSETLVRLHKLRLRRFALISEKTPSKRRFISKSSPSSTIFASSVLYS